MTGRSLPPAPGLCYLCGEPLAEPINRDHVPPDQIFAKALRKDHRLRLTTVPVHRDCNSAYKLDEEYFVQTLVPFARGSVAGNAMFAKTIGEFHAGNRKTASLVHRVLNAFEERPGGVYLPNGKVALRIEGDRFWRVVWKIVRGLHFVETGEVMPADWNVSYSVIIPGEQEPAHFAAFMQISREDFGAHKGVFAYRREVAPTSPPFAYWALLFWDRIILTAAFHPVSCPCEECAADRSAASVPSLASETENGPLSCVAPIRRGARMLRPKPRLNGIGRTRMKWSIEVAAPYDEPKLDGYPKSLGEISAADARDALRLAGMVIRRQSPPLHQHARVTIQGEDGSLATPQPQPVYEHDLKAGTDGP